ncbi:MAG: hypothetical protein IJ112_03060 [Oscillospiraceae bacterium]|nr:hypothetical protein [Oscillospiraceae bacterium]
MKQQKRTIHTIVLVIAITLLTKVLGVVREALQARVFGTALAFDLYTIAYNNTIYIFTTVAYALCVAAVPIISKQLEKDRKAAFRTAGNLICVSLVVSLVLTALLSLVVQLAPVARFLNVADANASALRTYLQICLLTLPLIVLIYLLVSVFQSMEHYTLQGSLSLPYNILLIVFLAVFARGEHMLTYILVVCLAWVLQLAMTVPSWVQEKFRFYPALRFRDPDVRLFFRTTVVTVFTTSIFLWCYLADSATVTRFGDGAVSAVYYADKLFTPVATTLIYSISVVLFPKYNQEYSRVSAREYKRYVGTTVENTLFVILPFSAMFMVFAVPIIHVLFEGGNFSAESTAMTSSVFAMYSIGMAGFCVLDLINKAYYTMGKTLTPLLINALVLGMDLVLNAVVRASGSGGSVAMVTAAALTVGGLVALVCFFRSDSGTLNVARVVKNVIAAAVMSGVLWALTKALYSSEAGKLTVLLIFLALGVLGIAIYIAVCWLLREREALQLIFARFRKHEG